MIKRSLLWREVLSVAFSRSCGVLVCWAGVIAPSMATESVEERVCPEARTPWEAPRDLSPARLHEPVSGDPWAVADAWCSVVDGVPEVDEARACQDWRSAAEHWRVQVGQAYMDYATLVDCNAGAPVVAAYLDWTSALDNSLFITRLREAASRIVHPGPFGTSSPGEVAGSACEAGSGIACTELGLGALGDIREWFIAGCAGGDPVGCHELAWFEHDVDAAKARTRWRAACKRGWIASCDAWAVDAYDAEQRSMPDLAAALATACDGGYPDSCYRRASWLSRGTTAFAGEDFVGRLAQACHLGHVQACTEHEELRANTRRQQLAEHDRSLRTRASEEIERVVSAADSWSPEAERDLWSVLERYDEPTVKIDNELVWLEPIDDLEVVRDWLNRYANRDVGQLGYAMVQAPTGTYRAAVRTLSGKVREVSLTRSFAVGVFEVSQGLWQRVMGVNPSVDPMCASAGVGLDYPVTCIDWFQAIAFANRLSRMEGLTPVYRPGPDGPQFDRSENGYRLLTEAEWEAVAGSEMGPDGGDIGYRRVEAWPDVRRRHDLCSAGNVADASAHRVQPRWPAVPCDDRFSELAPVGSFRESPLGMYDLIGNVREWTWDRFSDPTEERVLVDPMGPSVGTLRVVRGGAWCHLEDAQELGHREGVVPSYRGMDVGLRLARTVIPFDVPAEPLMPTMAPGP